MHLPRGDCKDTPSQWKNKQSHTKVIQSERQAEQPEPGTGTESFWIQWKLPSGETFRAMGCQRVQRMSANLNIHNRMLLS